jgi:hypothetical protein
MIIVDPVTLGDVACTRASSKWVFDRAGTLVQVPVDTLAVTYDPSDLSRAPYALVEPAATNYVSGSETLSNTNWWTGAPSATPVAATYCGIPYVRIAKTTSTANENYSNTFAGVVAGDTLVLRMALRADTVAACTVGLYDTTAGVGWGATSNASARIVDGPGAVTQLTGALCSFTGLSVTEDTLIEIVRTYPTTPTAGVLIYPGGSGSTHISDSILATRVQAEQSRATSYIPTDHFQVTRAADVIAAGAGLAYSNAPIDVQTYSAAATYAKDALAYDPVAHNVYQSIAAGNVGKALTDTSAWTPRGAITRWAMFDQYNNTQTSSPDEILVVLSPQAISQGLYLGNLFADEVRISVVDQVEGLVYSETKSLVESNSGSSFFNWAFRRIKRKDYFLTLKMPPYANALVTISLRKIGGTAKCGMCAIGPIDEFGPTLMGLSTEGKDYSSTTFNFDGTSSTIIRPYAKRMTCDVMVDNDQIDYLQARLFEIRQKPIVWVGGPYGSTAVYGRYESFKNVIQYATRSLMNLTIGGAV